MDALSYLNPVGKALPSVFKYMFVALFLVNYRSWPLVWHFKVLKCVLDLQARYLLLRVRCLFMSKKAKLEAREKWFDSLTPVGKNPFECCTTYSTWAGPDDCDFQMHLSNSCYAKNLDAVRYKAALEMFPTFFRCGGWMALAATHYKFVREIPMFTKYEIKMTMATWEDKWMYVLVRFVSYPKNKGKKGKQTITASDESSPSGADTPNSGPKVDLHTPVTNTGIPSSETMQKLINDTIRKDEADGSTLHCISVSELCCKIGRITVPPAIALGCEGYSLPSTKEGAKPYSVENPPPSWEKVKELKANYSLRKLRDFYKNGWKEVPEGERWWEQALGGAIEEKRKINLELLEGVQKREES
ncbi:THEM6/lcsJ thioesterase [Abortiporus biennis]